jgi:site-specific recombinase XerD
MTQDQLQEEIRQSQESVLKPTDYSETAYVEMKEFRARQLELLKDFLLTKKIEGCKNSTLRDYHDKVMKLIEWTKKDLIDLTTKDIKQYLMEYQEKRSIQESSLDQIRIVLCTFFRFLEDEELIVRNPVRTIRKIKADEKIRLPFTDEELVMIRDATKTPRDLAIVDLLYSSGIRIGELVSLNIKDMDFGQREFVVYGKGGTERICYFNAKTKVEILRYLGTRDDKEEALFVTLREPHRRLKKNGIRHMLDDIELRTGVSNIHPHRFRRTLATNLLEKGMSLEQVQCILGHKRLETTLVYAKISNAAVKLNHQRFTT